MGRHSYISRGHPHNPEREALNERQWSDFHRNEESILADCKRRVAETTEITLRPIRAQDGGGYRVHFGIGVWQEGYGYKYPTGPDGHYKTADEAIKAIADWFGVHSAVPAL